MLRIDFTGKKYFKESDILFIENMIKNVATIDDNKINKSLFLFSITQYQYVVISAFLKSVYLLTRQFLTKGMERKKDTLIFRNKGKEIFRIGDVSSNFDLDELQRIMEK